MSRGSGTCLCYKVEACTTFAAVAGKFIFTKEWQEFNEFSESIIGIPSSELTREASSRGFFGYHQAKALEHWLQAELHYKVIGLKTRIVEYKMEYSYNVLPSGKISESIDSMSGRDLVDKTDEK